MLYKIQDYSFKIIVFSQQLFQPRGLVGKFFISRDFGVQIWSHCFVSPWLVVTCMLPSKTFSGEHFEVVSCGLWLMEMDDLV